MKKNYIQPSSEVMNLNIESDLLLCSNGCTVDSTEEGDPEVGQLSGGKGWSSEDWSE